MTDYRAIDSDCKLIARMIMDGDATIANKKINALVAANPLISGNIRLNITNHLLDIIDHGRTDEEARPSEDG